MPKFLVTLPPMPREKVKAAWTSLMNASGGRESPAVYDATSHVEVVNTAYLQDFSEHLIPLVKNELTTKILKIENNLF